VTGEDLLVDLSGLRIVVRLLSFYLDQAVLLAEGVLGLLLVGAQREVEVRDVLILVEVERVEDI